MNAVADRRARKLRKGELAVRSVGRLGTVKKAAVDQGVSVSTVKRRMADYCEIMEFESPEHAIYWLDRQRKLTQIAQSGAFQSNPDNNP